MYIGAFFLFSKSLTSFIMLYWLKLWNSKIQSPFQVYLLTTSSEARKACLALFYNHAISDGQSGQVLINQILQTYTQISTPSLESVYNLNSRSCINVKLQTKPIIGLDFTYSVLITNLIIGFQLNGDIIIHVSTNVRKWFFCVFLVNNLFTLIFNG